MSDLSYGERTIRLLTDGRPRYRFAHRVKIAGKGLSDDFRIEALRRHCRVIVIPPLAVYWAEYRNIAYHTIKQLVVEVADE